MCIYLFENYLHLFTIKTYKKNCCKVGSDQIKISHTKPNISVTAVTAATLKN